MINYRPEKGLDREDLLNLYLTIFNSTHNAIIAIDTSTRIIFMNRTAEEWIGLKLSDTENVTISSVIPNSDLPRVLETGTAETAQKGNVAGRVVLANRSPIVSKGQIIGAVSVFQDISDLEVIADELTSTKQVNEQLNTVIDSMYDGLIIADGKGKILRINRTYETIANVTPSEYIGKMASQLVREGFVSESVTMKVIETGKQSNRSIQIKAGKDLFHSAVPIFDASGKLDRVVTVIRDLTELNSLKRRIEEAEFEKSLYYEKLKKINDHNGSLDIINFSQKMKEVFLLAEQASQFDTTILITGESGVGKEVVARYIHAHSKRREMPYIRVNCGAIPENLLESELFGYEKGAFTGAAMKGKRGLLEEAEHGSFLLDEISELPLNLQVKLLRLLQEREFYRVGGNKPIMFDIRFIATSNKNLYTLVKTNRFRTDLFYRLNVVQIDIPPLRERREEIPAFVKLFLNRFNLKYQQNKSISDRAISLLADHDWPGNIRELENTIERLAVTTQDDLITHDHISVCRSQDDRSHMGASAANPDNNEHHLKKAVDQLEKRMVRQAMERSGCTRKAAVFLGISQSTVVKKMKKHGLSG